MRRGLRGVEDVAPYGVVRGFGMRRGSRAIRESPLRGCAKSVGRTQALNRRIRLP